MKLPTAAELEEYKALTRFNLEEIQHHIAVSPRLRAFLEKTWADAVKTSIDEMEADLKFKNAAYHLFRIFRDESGLIQELEDGLTRIEPLARQAGKLDSFRETPLRLPEESMEQISQIESAIFEIIILRGLIRACSRAGIKIELYPTVGPGKSNIEARVWIDGRWCNIEAKALGYTKNLPGADGARVGTLNIDTMLAPITRALAEKAANGKQLALVPAGESAVVFLALKGIERQMARGTTHEFLISRPTPLSSVLLFGSAFCRTAPDLVAHTGATTPLTLSEANFLRTLHDHMGFSMSDYLQVGNRVLDVAKANINICGERPQNNMRERVILFLITKAVTTFESILRLEELDRDLDAQILARSLLEAYAQARYIHINDNPEATAREFVELMMKKATKVFKRAEKYDDPFYEDFLTRIDPDGSIRARTTNIERWPNTITQIFEKITHKDTGALPREWYDILCDLVHSNASAIPAYLDPKQNFKPFLSQVEPRPNRSALLHPLYATMMMALEVLCKTFCLPEPVESQEIIGALLRLPSAPTRPIVK